MKLKSVACLLVICVLVLSGPAAVRLASAGEPKFKVGEVVPDFTFSAPSSDKDRAYLGLEAKKEFHRSDVPAELLYVDIFGVLCQACQKNAPNMNKLHNYLVQDPALDKAVKIVGVAHESDYEDVKMFRKAFRVKFPLIPDESGTIFEQLGEPDTPYAVVLDRDRKIVLTHQGVIHNVEQFLAEIRQHLK